MKKNENQSPNSAKNQVFGGSMKLEQVFGEGGALPANLENSKYTQEIYNSNSTTKFARHNTLMQFVAFLSLFVLLIGTMVGATYSAFHATGSISGTITFTLPVHSITLDNQSADSAGTGTIYEQYTRGFFLESECSTQLTNDGSNTITIPTRAGYIFMGYYTSTSGSGTQIIQSNGKLSEGITGLQFIDSATIYAFWQDSPPEVTITRTDYNTFSWTASDSVGVTGYAITNSSTAPNVWTTEGTLTSGTYDISTANTWYVWAKNEAGNTASASIESYTISRSVGTGTSLTTRYDSTSESTGTEFNASIVVLAGTSVWAKSEVTTGYNTPTLSHGAISMTASGATFQAGATEAISSSATVNTYSASYVLTFINEKSALGGSATFNSTSLTATTSSQTVSYGSTYTLTATVGSSDYKFDGWYYRSGDGASGGTLLTTSTNYDLTWNYTADTHFYAQFSYNSLDLTITVNSNVSTIYYKVNGAADYSSTSSSTTVRFSYNTSIYWYATASTGYTIDNGCDSMQTISNAVAPQSISPTASDITPPTVNVSKTDYNTFSWTASDGVGVTGYAITNSSSAPSSWTTTGTLTSGTYDISTANTWYVWARDAAGNTASANIASYTVSRSQGTGSTLTTRYDSTSNSTGTEFTSNTAMLAGTSVWAKATADSGYNTATLKHGSTTMTASGASYSVNATEAITSGATANTYYVAFNGNGSTSGSMSNQTFTYGTAQNLTSNGFTAPSGYTFQGWATTLANAQAGTVAYTNGQSVNNLTETANDIVDLYAVWQRNITFYHGASNEHNTIVAQSYGGTITAPDAVACTDISGFTELGWRDDTTAGAKEIDFGLTSLSPTATTYYAVYSRNATFYSGINRATSSTATQYYNSSNVYSLTTLASSSCADITGWTKQGWRTSSTVASGKYNFETAVTDSSATYYALYSRVLTITYANGGGTGTAPSDTTFVQYYQSSPDIMSASFTLASNTFTKTGYSFNGWNLGAAGSSYTAWSPAVDDATVSKTATAQWTANNYNAYYNIWLKNDINVTAYSKTVQHAMDSTFTISESEITALGTVKGFSSSGKLYSNLSGTWTLYPFSTTFTQQAGNMNFNLDYFADTYTITYNLNGGTNHADNPATYNIVTGVTLQTPTKTGYTFAGWKDENNATITGINSGKTKPTGTASAILTELNSRTIGNRTLTATWTANTYYVRFNANGGTGSMSNQTFTYGTAQNLTSNGFTAPSGYTFQGWATTLARAQAGTVDHTNGKSVSNLTSTSGGTVDIYAVWKRTITFYHGSNKAANTALSHYYGGTITAPNAATCTDISGWTELGWRDDTTAGAKEVNFGATSLSPTATTYYAVYSRDATFYSGSNKAANVKKTQYYNSNNTYAVTTPAASECTDISGWTELGWRDDTTAGAQGTAFGAASTSSSATFYAVYSRNIAFKSGSNKATTTNVVQYYNSNNSSSNITTPTAATCTDISGWTELGWRDDTTAGAKEYDFNTSIAPSVTTYYAVYSRNIAFKSGINNATNTNVVQYYNSNNSSSNITTPTSATCTDISGWGELGWRDDTTAGAKEYNFSASIAPSVTIYYAVYSRTATITYANGGGSGTAPSNTSATQYYNSNSGITTPSFTLASNTFTRTGYTFNGWNLGAAGSTYSSWTPAVSATATQTATAQWKANTYTITYKDGGNTTFSGSHANGYPTTHTYGTATTLKSASKTGYTFGGWFTASACTGSAVASLGATTYTSGITLYAKWTANTYAVTFDKQSGSGGDDGVTATYGSAMPSVTIPWRVNRKFMGYYDATSGGTQYYTATGVSARNWDKASTATLYARWTTNAAQEIYNWSWSDKSKISFHQNVMTRYSDDHNKITVAPVGGHEILGTSMSNVSAGTYDLVYLSELVSLDMGTSTAPNQQYNAKIKVLSSAPVDGNNEDRQLAVGNLCFNPDNYDTMHSVRFTLSSNSTIYIILYFGYVDDAVSSITFHVKNVGLYQVS